MTLCLKIKAVGTVCLPMNRTAQTAGKGESEK